MKPLIVYYSRRGQNLVNGTVKDLPVGNTELLAAILQKLTDADSFRIEPQEDYAADYYRCIDEARQDLQKHRCPALKTLPKHLAEYDVIYLGYPNYWGTMPMPVASFLRQSDLAGSASSRSAPTRAAAWDAASRTSAHSVRTPRWKPGLPFAAVRSSASCSALKHG